MIVARWDSRGERLSGLQTAFRCLRCPSSGVCGSSGASPSTSSCLFCMGAAMIATSVFSSFGRTRARLIGFLPMVSGRMTISTMAATGRASSCQRILVRRQCRCLRGVMHMPKALVESTGGLVSWGESTMGEGASASEWGEGRSGWDRAHSANAGESGPCAGTPLSSAKSELPVWATSECRGVRPCREPKPRESIAQKRIPHQSG